MATLTTTITESITINNAQRGGTNTVTTTGITDVLKRTTTCPHSQTTTIAVFNTNVYSADGAIDTENVKYIRVSNLDTTSNIELACVTASTNHQVTITPGNSYILCQAEECSLDEEDASPSFGTMLDLVTLEVKPVGTSSNPQIELFVASV